MQTSVRRCRNCSARSRGERIQASPQLNPNPQPVHSVLEIIQRTEGYFREKAVPDPRLNAELLIGHVLGLKRLQLYLEFDRPMEEATLAKLRPLVRRRASREPLQHVLGEVGFGDCLLKVDRRALIPRPETEYLLQIVCKRFDESPPGRILDLGTGTGALALGLAAHFTEASVVALDQSAEALELAKENVAKNNLGERVRMLRSDWFSALADEAPFDLIVANPPYLTEAEMQSAAPEVIDYDPHSALLAADEGLADLRKIIAEAPAFLKPGGLLALESGIDHAAPLEALCQSPDWTGFEIGTDLANRPRFCFVRRA